MVKRITMAAMVFVFVFLAANSSQAAYVANQGAYACQTEEQLDQLLVAMKITPDEGPFSELMNSGKCVYLGGQSVDMVGAPSQSGKVQVRPQGSDKTLWTVPNFVTQK